MFCLLTNLSITFWEIAASDQCLHCLLNISTVHLLLNIYTFMTSISKYTPKAPKIEPAYTTACVIKSYGLQRNSSERAMFTNGLFQSCTLPKSQTQLTILPVICLLFEYLCVSTIQKRSAPKGKKGSVLASDIWGINKI